MLNLINAQDGSRLVNLENEIKDYYSNENQFNIKPENISFIIDHKLREKKIVINVTNIPNLKEFQKKLIELNNKRRIY